MRRNRIWVESYLVPTSRNRVRSNDLSRQAIQQPSTAYVPKCPYQTRSPGARTSATGTINAIYSCKNFCLQCSQQAITLFVVLHELARELEAFLKSFCSDSLTCPQARPLLVRHMSRRPAIPADEPRLPGVPPIHGSVWTAGR